MIFATVGSQKFQFNRIFQMLDELIESGAIQDEVFAQIGNSDYQPKNYLYASFLNKDEFDRRIHTCDVLITHGGVATVIAGLKNQKPVIVVPRLSKYKEHVDDHQVQIAESFEEQNYVVMYREGNCLDDLLRYAESHNFSTYCSQRDVVVNTIKDYLVSIDSKMTDVQDSRKIKRGL